MDLVTQKFNAIPQCIQQLQNLNTDLAKTSSLAIQRYKVHVNLLEDSLDKNVALLQDVKERNKRRDMECIKLQNLIERLEDEIRNKKVKITGLKKECLEWQTKFKNCQKEYLEWKSQLMQCQKECLEWKTKFMDCQSESQNDQDKVKQLRNLMGICQNVLDDLTTPHHQLTEKMEKMQKENVILQKTLTKTIAIAARDRHAVQASKWRVKVALIECEGKRQEMDSQKEALQNLLSVSDSRYIFVETIEPYDISICQLIFENIQAYDMSLCQVYWETYQLYYISLSHLNLQR